jgi:hypothetical protein
MKMPAHQLPVSLHRTRTVDACLQLSASIAGCVNIVLLDGDDRASTVGFVCCSAQCALSREHEHAYCACAGHLPRAQASKEAAAPAKKGAGAGSGVSDAAQFVRTVEELGSSGLVRTEKRLNPRQRRKLAARRAAADGDDDQDGL